MADLPEFDRNASLVHKMRRKDVTCELCNEWKGDSEGIWSVHPMTLDCWFCSMHCRFVMTGDETGTPSEVRTARRVRQRVSGRRRHATGSRSMPSVRLE